MYEILQICEGVRATGSASFPSAEQVAFVQEYRSEQSLQALTKLLPPRTTCLRGGKVRLVQDAIDHDSRSLHCREPCLELRVDEALLVIHEDGRMRPLRVFRDSAGVCAIST